MAPGPGGSAWLVGEENIFSVSWPDHRAELCFFVGSGNITSVGWDCLHRCTRVCYTVGVLMGNLPQKRSLAAAQTSPCSLLSYSFDVFLIARKQAKPHLLPTTHRQPTRPTPPLRRSKLTSDSTLSCKTFPKCLTKTHSKTSPKREPGALRAWRMPVASEHLHLSGYPLAPRDGEGKEGPKTT